MGDLVAEPVAGALYFAEKPAFERVRASNADSYAKAALFADLARLNTLYMIAKAGSGHIGSSFSSLDFVTWLYLEELREGDIYFSSKGHDAPGLYAVLTAFGVLPFDKIHGLRRIDGLPGHPDIAVPGIAANTGSLGMGISKAKGMAFAHRLVGRKNRIFVMTGDGELQEGQFWESLISAANHRLGEITAIVDHNKIQSDYSVERTSSLGDLAAKFRAFGWAVIEADGHDFAAIESSLDEAANSADTPTAIIAHTIKGKGVSFMEGVSIDSDVERFKFHSGAPSGEDYRRAVKEIIARIERQARAISLPSISIATSTRPEMKRELALTRLIPAYSEALLDQAKRNEKLVALDADLAVDMGLETFRESFPDRFVECGIAEMDMVSQAGGMALSGLTPVVHSFSCFLSTRPNEQIYNNATERTKIVYVGGLAGVLPAGPGHSHQSVRDISLLASIPNMAVVEAASPEDVAPLFDWCLNAHQGPSFLRLVSAPYPAGFTSRPPQWLIPGRGWTVRDGADALIFASGLVGLSQACAAAARLEENGVAARVVNMPWLNIVDEDWLVDCVAEARAFLVVDNHYERCGLGDMILSAWARAGGAGAKADRLGLADIPPSGANEEVLRATGLAPGRIAERLLELIG